MLECKEAKNGGSDGTRTRGLRRDRPPNSLEKSVALPTFSIPEEKEIVAAVGTLKNKAAELGATLACNSPTCPEQGSASLYLQNSAVRVATDALSLGISLGLGGRRNVLFIPPDDIRPSSLALAGPSITFFSIDGGGRAGLPGINLMDRFNPGARTAVSRRQRSFSRPAIGVAGVIMAVGLALIGAAVNRLDLFETLGAETFAVAVGFALVLLGVIALAAYAVVRAIEWASRA